MVEITENQHSLSKSPYDMIDMDEALKIVIQESLNLKSSLSSKLVDIDFLAKSPETYLLAESVKAQDDLPPFRASIMDGFALSST